MYTDFQIDFKPTNNYLRKKNPLCLIHSVIVIITRIFIIINLFIQMVGDLYHRLKVTFEKNNGFFGIL